MTPLLDFLKRVDKIARAHAPDGTKRPYKPLLLFSVLLKILNKDDRFLGGQVSFEAIEAPYLELLSKLYPGGAAKPTQAVQPFWKLGQGGNSQIWTHVAHPGGEAELQEMLDKPSGHQIKARSRLKKLVKETHFEPDDWELIQQPANCRAIIYFLMAVHFPNIEKENRQHRESAQKLTAREENRPPRESAQKLTALVEEAPTQDERGELLSLLKTLM